MIVDGTLIACDRLAASRPFYSGKHKQHGVDIQVIAALDGEPLWTSWSLPDAVRARRNRVRLPEGRAGGGTPFR